MEINNISISVNDLEESVRFYENVLGFKKVESYKTGLGDAVMLDAGNVKVSLFKTDKIPVGIFDFNIAVPNLEESLENAKNKGARIIMEPQQAGIGRMAKIWDPSGISVMLSELNKNGEKTENKITHLPNREK